jgi:hypothetical protein
MHRLFKSIQNLLDVDDQIARVSVPLFIMVIIMILLLVAINTNLLFSA